QRAVFKKHFLRFPGAHVKGVFQLHLQSHGVRNQTVQKSGVEVTFFQILFQGLGLQPQRGQGGLHVMVKRSEKGLQAFKVIFCTHEEIKRRQTADQKQSDPGKTFPKKHPALSLPMIQLLWKELLQKSDMSHSQLHPPNGENRGKSQPEKNEVKLFIA